MVLDDKVALVTGAARGMGRAIALGLAEAGAHVAGVDIDGPAMKSAGIAVSARAALTAREQGRRSLAIQADVGDLDEIDRMVKETLDYFGRVDILVNNAGVTRYLDLMEVEEADWDRIHRVNAKGVFFCMQRVARELINRGEGGRIVNIASIAGKGYSGTSNAAYAASKGAVISMTHIAAHQLGRYDINVNAICPGMTRTAMSQATMIQRSESTGVPLAEMEAQRASRIPIGRVNDPEDIAAMAVFLAGPGARNITGQTFNIDGGLVMH
jgi:NAD(P)-dependent dehydrogenase (short-subunit alcohol dehydrogenase family)